MHVYRKKGVIGGLERSGGRLKKHRVCEGRVQFSSIEIYGGMWCLGLGYVRI